MSTPRILVIGAGSAGARHARHLLDLGAEVAVTDLDAGRVAAVAGASMFDGALDRMDGIVIASPTASHAKQLDAALRDSNARVLVEKPLGVTADECRDTVERDGDRIMVGYNLRLHPPVQRVVELVAGGVAGTPRFTRLWFGSYLPDWRPAQDYRTSYSARRELGGGILLDAIHELDLAVWLLGDDLTVEGAQVARLGALDIDVEDTVVATVRNRDGALATISLDYLSRRYRRGIEVIGDDATVRLDWARQVIEIEDANGVTTEAADAEVAGSYRAEAERFLAWVTDRVPPPVDGRTGLASLVLADRIREVGQR